MMSTRSALGMGLLSLAAATVMTHADNHDTWPIFRGDSALTGVAEGSLTFPMTSKWEFQARDEIRGSAVVADGRVVLGDTSGRIYALDFATGKSLWTFDTDDVIEASPLLVEDLVIVGAMNGKCYALSATNGTVQWTYDVDARIMGSANASHGGGMPTRIIFGAYDSKLHALDLAGTPLWTFETEGFINGTPAISDSLAIFGGCDAKLHAIALSNGTAVAAVDLGSYVAASPAVRGDLAYVGHYGGQLFCIDLAAEQVRWTYGDEEAANPFFASPAITKRHIAVGSRDGKLHCVNAEDGKVDWTFSTGGDVDSSPVICDGKVVFGSQDGRLYALRLTDGAKLWSYDTGSPIVASPTVINGTLIIATEEGLVLAFQPESAASKKEESAL
jgi:eukaryotic-like serine/threonine-protein kinase